VDDEVRILDVGTQMLREFGYRVTCFLDPRAALRAIQQEPHAFDIVVTDHSMPEIDGLELATRIRALRSEMPILLLSGSPELIPRDSARRAVITECLTKPISMSELAARIKILLAGKTSA
jgi:DNA-binding response OmpR family regulator